MPFSFLGAARSSRGAALLLALSTSLGAAACGQEGITPTGSSGDTNTGGGGAGGSTNTAGAGGTGGTGGAEDPEPLKILNWNLHNLFDTKKDSESPEEQVLSGSDYNNKLQRIGKVLKEMDPDIAILPEVENKAILDDLNAKQLGGAYTTAITETNDFRGLDIGVLSKIPIVDLVSHKDDSFKRLDLVGGQSYKYSRDAVEVRFKFNTRSLVLFGVHYRSKGDGSAETDDKDKRMAEAQHTRALADAITKDAPNTAILILGDFNDLPASPPVTWTLQGDPKNSPKIPFSASTDAVTEADRYTFVYQGVEELIDYQMANKLLAGMLDTGSVQIRHDQDVEDASDHYPLMATYQIQ